MNIRIILAIVPVAALLAAAMALAGSLSASAQSQSTIGLIGADALIDGNTATKIGPRDSCVRTEVGSEVVVDIIVDEIPVDRPLIGFQMNVLYDPNLLEVVQANSDMILGAKGQYQPFPGLSDPLPDTDGDYQIINADLASNNPPGANEETGKGVLSRITFRAKAPGRSNVAIGYQGQEVYPGLQDLQNTTIGVDSIASTVVAIGEECGVVPPEAQVQTLPPITEALGTPTAQGGDPSETPTRTLAPNETPGPTDTPAPSGDGSTPEPSDPSTPTQTPVKLPDAGDGTDAGMVAAAIVLALIGAAMAGGGGFILYRRGQSSGTPTAG